MLMLMVPSQSDNDRGKKNGESKTGAAGTRELWKDG